MASVESMALCSVDGCEFYASRDGRCSLCSRRARGEIRDAVPDSPHYSLLAGQERFDPVAEYPGAVYYFSRFVVIVNHRIVVLVPSWNGVQRYTTQGVRHYFHKTHLLCIGERVICADVAGYLTSLNVETGTVIRSPQPVQGGEDRGESSKLIVALSIDVPARFIRADFYCRGRRAAVMVDPATLDVVDEATAGTLPILPTEDPLGEVQFKGWTPRPVHAGLEDLPLLAQHNSDGREAQWSQYVCKTEGNLGTIVVSFDKTSKTLQVHFAPFIRVFLMEVHLDEVRFRNVAGDEVHVADIREEIPHTLWMDLARAANHLLAGVRIVLPDRRVVAHGDLEMSETVATLVAAQGMVQ